jgi:hypothetical protein
VKVAIDIRRMTEFGIGTYIRNVVRTLARLDHDSNYFLIGSPEKVAEFGALPPNFHLVALAGAMTRSEAISISARSCAACNATWFTSRICSGFRAD